METQRRAKRANRAGIAAAVVATAIASLCLAACSPAGVTPAQSPAATPSTGTAASPGPAADPSAEARPARIHPSSEQVEASTPDGPLEAAPLPTTEAALTEPVAFDTGMVIEVTAVERIEVTAQTPGETDGPALRVTVTAHNTSPEPQELDSAVVMLEAGGELGIDTTAGDPSPLSGVVESGATASGTYVFMLDPSADREIAVSVNYAAGEPVAVFTGMTP